MPSTTTTEFDTENQFDWESISTTITEGVIDSIDTIYDDGVVKYELFENGVRVQTFQDDNLDEFGEAPADGGAKSWTSIQTNYTETGQIADRETRYDDGVVKFEDFENGVRSRTFQDDNLDEFGEAPADGGAKSWTSIQTNYDETGQIAQQSILYDNGVEATKEYENGMLQFDVREDVADEFEWNLITTTYEGGERVAKQTQYDNLDSLTQIFDDKMRVAQIEMDGDNSDSWAFEVTEFGLDGATVATYDSFEELPEEFAIYFDQSSMQFA